MSSSTAADPASGSESEWDGGWGTLVGPDGKGLDPLERAQRLTAPILRGAVDNLPGELRLMAGYHLGWWDAEGVPAASAPGKGLRPALVLAAARALGAGPDAALHAAAAIELVHNFTLVHDDVMDGDVLRRGRPTVWRVWGVDDAVLVGDALHGLAIWTLADAPRAAQTGMGRLAEAVIELCLGQHFDCAETSLGLTVEDCMQTLRYKTGALLGCACALGAVCAEAAPEAIAAMDGFGRELGVAFQLADDLLGIWGDPALTGKPRGSDLLRHKMTLPMLAALESDTAAGREFAELYSADRPLDAASAAHAADLVERAGGKGWAQSESARHVRAAKAYLSELGGRSDQRELIELADGAVDRQR
ncbi:polyprenyl synthetase family protein [Nocardia sp. NPDC057668]|uniref:polyprenyl synthetase family protein n=1 Tax=Nocardia sp. NPDC057668 TaxID=3346202 RepID=UPI00366F8329